MASSVVFVVVVVGLAALVGYVCYRVARAMYRVARIGYNTGRMAGQPPNIRLRRRAVLDLAVSVLMLLGFAFAWLVARLPGWFIVLGLLLVIQALAYMVFAYRAGPDLGVLRRNWLQVTAACAVWSAGVILVAAQISVALAIGFFVLALLWVGLMLRIYVEIRRRRSAVP